MLASLSGSLALAIGLAVMLLPLLSPELSRPRDAAWGALVLVLGLTLVSSADRLTGSPMLAVLCGGLLVGRLGSEVMQLRWRQLTPEEQQRLASRERWQESASELTTSMGVLGASLGRSGSVIATSVASLTAALKGGSKGSAGQGGSRRSGKRWVRPEPHQALAHSEDAASAAAESANAPDPGTSPPEAVSTPAADPLPDTVVVSSTPWW